MAVVVVVVVVVVAAVVVVEFVGGALYMRWGDGGLGPREQERGGGLVVTPPSFKLPPLHFGLLQLIDHRTWK